MASMLDQFNASSTRTNTQQHEDLAAMSNRVMTIGSGFVPISSGKSPIFTKHKMNFTMPHAIHHMAICNGNLVLVMANKVVFRMQLNDIDRSDEVALEKFCAGCKISNIFLDPLGVHLLISLAPSPQFTPELLYLHKSQKRPKKIDKFRDYEVISVAFNYENNSETSTGPILLGTTRGLIFESEFGIEGDRPVQNNWKQVFNIGQSHVTGLKFFRVPATNNYVVLATSEDKLFKYQETVKGDDRSPFQGIFSAYLNVPEHVRDFQSTAHPSKATTSKLRVCYDNKTHFPRSFGWLTDSGIFFGDMDPLSETPAHIVTNAIIPFPELITPMGQKTFPAPIAFTLTDFHALLVFPDRLCAVSLLNYQTVYEEYINETFGPLLNAIRDPRENVIYVYTKKVIFRIKVTNEQRNAWQIYLDKGEFEYALKYAQDNPLHRDTILTKQAEMSFDSKDFQRAAEIFAETKFSFEGICLKFLALNENGALMTYLRRRLIDQGANDTIQITMLVVWLVELYLTEKARNSGNSVKVSELERNFDEFMELKPVKECIKRHKTVVYDLIASHGDNQYLAKLNAGSQDFESVINQYIDQNKFVDALKILRNQKQADSFYKYGPILMEDIPKETVHALMEQRSLLEPVKLIPTLICLESQTHIEEVIRYLEFSVLSLNCRDQAVHNYLIKLYTEHMPEKLMTYLETQGKDHTIIQYDLHYALRICREKSCNMASVFLQCLIGMWHEAVELALTFDSSLAERTASMPKDKELKRKLWLRIAEHEIKDKKDNVTEALKLLKTCDLLRIEDILPFFSDFHKIDDFKEAICDALKEYNLTILEQKRDMEESAKAADRVRADLQHFRNRSVAISSSDLCAICGTFVLARPFFIFPCGHKFHLDCLEKQARNHMDKEHCVKLVHLRQRLNPESADFPRLKAEYERTLAAECFHCGEVMISAIDEPFVSNWERINADWE